MMFVSDYMKYVDYKKEKKMKDTSNIRNEVLREIQTWVNARHYPCLVDFNHFIGGMGEIEGTRMNFLPCGIIDIHWDEVKSADETITAILGHVTKLHKEYHERVKQNRDRAVPAIEKVIFNEPATIIFWKDGTKTVVKCSEDDEFNPEVGMAMAISKKALGNKGNYCNEFKKWVEPYWAEQDFARSLSDAFRNAADNINRLAEALGLTTEKSMHHGCTDCKYGSKSLAYPVCRDCTVTSDDNDDHVFSNWEPITITGIAQKIKPTEEIISNATAKLAKTFDARVDAFEKYCSTCKHCDKPGNVKPCNSCNFPLEHSNWEPKESESLKGVEIGKKIGEGFVDGMNKESRESVAEKKLCVNCRYTSNPLECAPCCICSYDRDKWEPKEDVKG